MSSVDVSGRIQGKLEELRARDPMLRVFGASEHRYALGPCLVPTVLEDLERRYGLALPPGYRRFLLEVGNGGAGPGLGLERFGLVDADGTCIPSIAPGADPLRGHYWDACIQLAVSGREALGRAFPLRAPLLAQDIYEVEGTVASLDDALAELVLEDGTDTLSFGRWSLADYGCAIGAVLVVAGDERGHVWIDDLANTGAFVDHLTWARLSERDATVFPRDATFLGWYEHWLDASLDEAKRGASPPGPIQAPELIRDRDPVQRLREAIASHDKRTREAREREERDAAREARRAEERPRLQAASAAILAATKVRKEGAYVDGECPKCGARASLRICAGAMVLCAPCYFAF